MNPSGNFAILLQYGGPLDAFTIFSTALYTITIPSRKVKKTLKKSGLVQCTLAMRNIHISVHNGKPLTESAIERKLFGVVLASNQVVLRQVTAQWEKKHNVH